MLAVLAFAWPAARIAPRDLPVGIVGTGAARQQARGRRWRAEPGGFDLHLYADEPRPRGARSRTATSTARSWSSRGRITVLEASAASPTVAQLLTTAGQQHCAGSSHAGRRRRPRPGGGRGAAARAAIPRGLVLSSALLPLTICSIIIAAAVALLLGFRPAWRQILALCVAPPRAWAPILIAQGFLGALPHEHLATWAALALTMLAISATTAGLIALIGPPGLGLGAALMVFIGNPFSGATSAPAAAARRRSTTSASGCRRAPAPACSAAPPTSAATAPPATSRSCWPGAPSGCSPSSSVTTPRRVRRPRHRAEAGRHLVPWTSSRSVFVELRVQPDPAQLRSATRVEPSRP